MTPWLADATHSHVVITATERQTRYLRNHWHAFVAAQGGSVSAPTITSYTTFCQSVWQQAIAAGEQLPAVLPRHVERSLWLQTFNQRWLANTTEIVEIRGKEISRMLLDTIVIANRMFHVWQLRHHHYSTEYEVFYNWQRAFQNAATSLDVIDAAAMQSKLAKLCQYCPDVDQVIWYGFNELTTVQQQLKQRWDGVTHQSCPFWPAHTPLASIALQPCENNSVELENAAHWAQRMVQQYPSASVAVICDSLTQQWDALHYQFSKCFDAECNAYEQWSAAKHVFAFSAGKPLAQQPPISIAISLLQLNTSSRCSDITPLWTSPYLQHYSSWQRQRHHAVKELNAHAWENAAQWLRNNNNSDPLLAAFSQGISQTSLATAQQNADGWMHYISKTLAIFGWMDGVVATSHEYQQLEQWHTMLAQLRALNVLGDISWDDFFHQFLDTCNTTMYQPERHDAQISILGMREALGLQFDHMLILTMQDHTFPPQPVSNPFIPAHELQRAVVTNGSVASCVQTAEQILISLRSQCQHIVASYVTKIDEIPSKPSRLIAEYNTIAAIKAAAYTPTEHPQLYTSIADDVPPPQSKQLTGGITTIELQAACHFKGFARGRLRLQPLRQPQASIDAMHFGSWLHELMRQIWQQLQTSAALKIWKIDKLQGLVASHAHAIVDNNTMAQVLLTPPLQHALINLLTTAAMQALTIDRQRVDFSVLHSEHVQEITIAGFTFTVRIDRIDTNQQLDDGLYIIDYKTGNANIAELLGPRIAKPQLAVYSFVVANPIALLYFRVNAESDPRFSSKYIGYAAAEAALPLKSRGFEVKTFDKHIAVSTMQHDIISTIEHFRAGMTTRNPRTVQLCTTCDYRLVCRLPQ